MPPRRRRSRGHIEQLPSGNYRAIVYLVIDPLTGRKRYLKEVAPDAADVALTKLQHQVDEDRHPKTAMTVRQAIEQWLDVARLSETTRERYEDLIRLYVRPRLGHLQAGKLDAEFALSPPGSRPTEANEPAAPRPSTGTTGTRMVSATASMPQSAIVPSRRTSLAGAPITGDPP
jgi:hypothetical protein